MKNSNAPDDPIFSAIERHTSAYRRRLELGAIYAHTDKDEDDATAYEALNASLAAAVSLTTTMPTTLDGLIALVRYVEDYNRGAIFLESDRANWQSAAEFWPETIPGQPDDATAFPWALIANIHRALAGIRATSVGGR
jgi:hypothetical protein